MYVEDVDDEVVSALPDWIVIVGEDYLVVLAGVSFPPFVVRLHASARDILRKEFATVEAAACLLRSGSRMKECYTNAQGCYNCITVRWYT